MQEKTSQQPCEGGREQPHGGEEFSDTDSPPSWGHAQNKDQPLRLFRVKVVEKKETDEGVSYDGISDLFYGM